MGDVLKIFVGSSTESLPVATAITTALNKLGPPMHAVTWSDSSIFPLGLATAERLAQLVNEFDFGVFVLGSEDLIKSRDVVYYTSRDNVVYEAGIFTGGLGLERSLLVPCGPKGGERPKLLSDLQGIEQTKLVEFGPPREPDVSKAVEKITHSINRLGPAVRNFHNELLVLKTFIQEKRFWHKKKQFKMLGVVKDAAKRKTPWLCASEPRELLENMKRNQLPDSVIDDCYWWLVVFGVFAFIGIDHFTSGDGWHWAESVECVKFSERGVALLNDLRMSRR